MGAMSFSSSPGSQSGEPHPYSYESASGPAPEPQRELAPEEVAAAAAWASTLNPEAPDFVDPYSAYADPYGQTASPYAAPPYGQNQPPAQATPYADVYGPHTGQRPPDNPYVQTNPYAMVPAQSYGLYTPYGRPLQNHPMAVPSMVVSLVSWVICPFVGLVGMFMGISSLNAINREPNKYTGKGVAITGIILGALAGLGSILGFMFFFLIGVAG